MSLKTETLTAESVTKELEELEASYKTRRRTLKALAAALKAEAGIVDAELAEEGGDAE